MEAGGCWGVDCGISGAACSSPFELLLKPSICSKLDQGEGYIGCVRGFTNIEMRL